MWLADAADAEGKCLKAEVEILRSTAKHNAAALAKLEQQSQSALVNGAVPSSPQPSDQTSQDGAREVYLPHLKQHCPSRAGSKVHM